MRERARYAQLHQHPPPLRGPKVPWKELALSVGLFLGGTTLLLFGIGMAYFQDASEALPLFMLGALLFIPGSYHSFIFLMIFRKVPGYSYDMIPGAVTS